jgi:hypothetical protein
LAVPTSRLVLLGNVKLMRNEQRAAIATATATTTATTATALTHHPVSQGLLGPCVVSEQRYSITAEALGINYKGTSEEANNPELHLSPPRIGVRCDCNQQSALRQWQNGYLRSSFFTSTPWYGLPTISATFAHSPSSQISSSVGHCFPGVCDATLDAMARYLDGTPTAADGQCQQCAWGNVNLKVMQTWFNSESGMEAGVSQLRHAT